ncbi:MAG: glycoside hydrolase family 57 protein [Candidatus Nanoarchaeia archaeon]
MVSVCMYFQVHQPLRLRHYTIFDIGKNHNYFDDAKNAEILKKVAQKSYKPTNEIILKLIEKTKGKFKVSYSMSGVVLEQLEQHCPDVIKQFRKMVNTGCVELLNETYYHSLAYLYSKKEFYEQVKLHRKKIKELFDYTPKVFRNTELIYKNELAYDMEKMGFKAILAEGADHILGWRSPNYVYKAKTTKDMKLLLKNYRLSDDIAFRFSTRDWPEWPLTAPKYAQWISAINGNGNTVNLFMDYETFGEHQWEETGIFKFLERMPQEILKHPDNDFKTVSEVAEAYTPVDELDVHHPISWADMERDLTAWLGNKMQRTAISKLYAMEELVKKTKDKKIIEEWRKLQTSDHFYYMCTKWFADGDVHKYFNPYNNPYDGFIIFMNVLEDMKERIQNERI